MGKVVLAPFALFLTGAVFLFLGEDLWLAIAFFFSSPFFFVVLRLKTVLFLLRL